ncbi:rhodanese-like domain-containing protein [Undibacterium rugosum]|uniref:rhodanese-like domain-containing protein n=1 Tax=Undibacterium rugosum TaxID=2762291 RepID=UPI001B82353E|nr:rhodanese-like domain-containing protein [Undibacterium rugosum]MBR7779170.1 rhodanese-like domain-containing protein [Undibacterium rugosum]
MSLVTEVAAADSQRALVHFSAMLEWETDCWDVHDALSRGKQDFVLLDVRSHALYAAGHINGAISLPHGKIVATTMKNYAAETLFVVYCAGPHCNGAIRAAIRLSGLGLPVKTMPGGVTGWLDEGFSLISDVA